MVLESLQIDGAESCTAPGGRRLELQARDGLRAGQRALDQACKDLEEAQEALELQRTDIPLPGDDLDGDDKDKGIGFVAAMKSRVHEREGALRLALKNLDDAEAMLERAVLRRRKEDHILALFAALGAAEATGTSWDHRATEDPPYTTANTVDLAVGLTILCSDVLADRVRVLLRIFDYDGDGFLEQAEIVAALKCASRLLGGLGFLKRPAADLELDSVALRAIAEQRVATDGLGMTLYEAQDWLVHLVANSTFLSGLFNVKFAFGELSAYQRQKIPVVRLFELGLLRPADVKYHIAQDAARYRPQLFTENKLTLHERAFARGSDDPLKSDYSRFLPKSSSRSLSKIVPLKHGHLANLTVYEHNIAFRCACLLQNAYRGAKSRGKAEHLAKVQAFQQAQIVATNDARAKVVADFQAKEAQTGLSRHTWDAKVRIFQARKRAEGHPLDRDAAVRMMQEEACEAVAKQVGKRFAEMQKERGLTADGKHAPKPGAALAPPPKDVRSLHNTIRRARRRAAAAAPEDPGYGAAAAYKVAYESQSTKRVESMVLGSFPQGLHATGENDYERSVRRAYGDPDPPEQELQIRLRSINQVLTSLKTDELLLELPSKRLLMKYVERALGLDHACLGSDSIENHLFGGAFGAPELDVSRATLVAYRPTFSPAFPGLGLPDVEEVVRGRKIEFFPKDLDDHFRIVHTQDVVAEALRKFLCSDFESGLLSSYVVEKHATHDSWLQRRAVEVAEAGAASARDLLDRKVRAALSAARPGTTPAMLINPTVDELMEGYDGALAKLDAAAKEARSSIAKLQNKLRIMDILGNPPGVVVAPRDREDWTERYFAALAEAAGDSAPTRLSANVGGRLKHADALRLEELVAVCEGFLDVALRGATTILHEMHLPPAEKTIKPCHTKDADGRAVEAGRGVDGGLVYKYEAWNVRFEICVDDHGIFNGSDEYAAKAGGHHRNGAREYLRQALECENVRAPLSCTVDYHGFRVLAVAKLDLVQVTFGEGGEVRREREELVHGTDDRGSSLHNSNRAMDHILAAMAAKLNLAKHAVKGSKDLNAKEMWASVDLRGFRMADQKTFGLLNLWRAFPSESPEETKHLAAAPRGHSIFWRMLRPEYVRSLPLPLSPDANCAVTSSTADGDEHTRRAREATRTLVTERLAALAEHLAARGPLGPQPAGPPVNVFGDVAQGDDAPLMDVGFGDGDQKLGAARNWGLDVTAELHQRGVNLRHLGLLRQRFWRRLTGGARCDFGSNVLRTSVDFRLEVGRGARLLVAGHVFHVSKEETRPFTQYECPVDETFEGLSTNDVPVFTGEVRDARNSSAVRVAILVEMVARSAKNLLRFALRRSAQLHGNCVVASVATPFAVDLLNAITGAHARADATWREELVPGVLQRFGDVAVNPVESVTVRSTLLPTLPYLVRRVCALAGVEVSHRSLAALDAAPEGFEFTPQDLSAGATDNAATSLGANSGASPAVRPIVKHGVPFLDVARGTLLAARARASRGATFGALVLSHRPPLYLPLDERPGSHLARNRGDAGHSLDGYFTQGITPGVAFASAHDASMDDVRRGEGARCCRFSPEEGGHIVCAYAARCAPQKPSEHFTMELWALVAPGGEGTARVAAMTGRGALSVRTTDDWCFTLFCGVAEIVAHGPPARIGSWNHVCGSYDGTMMRLLVNARLVAQVEVEVAPEVARFDAAASAARRETLDKIDDQEKEARDMCKDATEKQATQYMRSKEGLQRIKAAAIKLVEQADFKAKMDNKAKEHGKARLGKQEALQQARANYRTELYMSNVKNIANEFRRLRDDVADRTRKELDAALERSRRPVVVGATCPSGRARSGRHFWHGCLSHVAVYDGYLSPDDVARHALAGATGGSALGGTAARERDAARLFALAAERFACAVVHQPDDPRIREHYALVLCDHLDLEDADPRNRPPGGGDASPVPGPALRRAAACLDRTVAALEAHGCAETLCELLRRLPDGPLHAHRAVDVFDALLRVDPAYFANPEAHYPLTELARVPPRFGLGARDAAPRLRRAAATVYRLVLGELSLAEIYGGVDLSWARDLASDAALCALVKQAEDDEDARAIELGNLGDADGISSANGLTDADVKLVCNARRLAVTLDLTACADVTDDALEFAAKSCTSLQSLTLDGCAKLTDAALFAVAKKTPNATLLSLQGCGRVTNGGLEPLCGSCRHLMALNLSYCGGVNNATLGLVARFLRDLELFHVAFCTDISDSGARPRGTLRADFNGRTDGTRLVGRASGTRREHTTRRKISRIDVDVTERETFDVRPRRPGAPVDSRAGVYAFATKCFVPKLKSLDLSFCSAVSDDGVAAVAEKCTNLEYLNVAGLHRALHVSECTRLSDHGLGGLSTRCLKLAKLYCAGVAGITDAGVGYLTREPSLDHARGDKLRVLDLSRCCAVSDGAVDALARSCPTLEEVNVGCCLLLTDRATKTLCDHCPSIKSLGLARCRRMTDASACLVADALWLEALDVSHNPRLTDAATECCVELMGLTALDLSGCVGLTDAALAVLRYHATNLHANQHLAARTVDDVDDAAKPQWVPNSEEPPPAPRSGAPPPPPAA
ncbi:hypothetical protein JL720_5123 [Aureococcus anophagefferens]|nr:hypothetical protein JL720_5123 [Aureococcus anophagefferens]